MSRFLPYTQRIDPGIRYDRPSLEQAIEENYFEIIMGGLARRDYLTALFETSDLRELPYGHLRDHRVTVPEFETPVAVPPPDAAIVQEPLRRRGDASPKASMWILLTVLGLTARTVRFSTSSSSTEIL